DDVFFFFQAEDGIRDWSVTGVQPCALPISEARLLASLDDPGMVEAGQQPGLGLEGGRVFGGSDPGGGRYFDGYLALELLVVALRSEERRVGEEGGRWGGAEPAREAEQG